MTNIFKSRCKTSGEPLNSQCVDEMLTQIFVPFSY